MTAVAGVPKFGSWAAGDTFTGKFQEQQEKRKSMIALRGWSPNTDQGGNPQCQGPASPLSPLPGPEQGMASPPSSTGLPTSKTNSWDSTPPTYSYVPASSSYPAQLFQAPEPVTSIFYPAETTQPHGLPHGQHVHSGVPASGFSAARQLSQSELVYAGQPSHPAGHGGVPIYGDWDAPNMTGQFEQALKKRHNPMKTEDFLAAVPCTDSTDCILAVVKAQAGPASSVNINGAPDVLRSSEQSGTPPARHLSQSNLSLAGQPSRPAGNGGLPEYGKWEAPNMTGQFEQALMKRHNPMKTEDFLAAVPRTDSTDCMPAVVKAQAGPASSLNKNGAPDIPHSSVQRGTSSFFVRVKESLSNAAMRVGNWFKGCTHPAAEQ